MIDADIELPAQKRIRIEYTGGKYWDAHPQFPPFSALYDEVREAINLRDSLDFLTDSPLTKSDSVVFIPRIKQAGQRIEAYSRTAGAGFKIEKQPAPNYSNVLGKSDESHNYLVNSSSTLLDDQDFMFFGGAPFLYQDPDVFQDPLGKPETRYSSNITSRTQDFFTYLYSRHQTGMEITYGPPLPRYDAVPIEINGIGSITHQLKERIPVWFLTTEGAVQGSLISANMRLGEEYGCETNYTTYLFGCTKNIDPTSILGLFYSDNLSLQKSKSSAPSDGIWEYDIDGDNTIDLIRVTDNGDESESASGMAIATAIWYARIKNEWVVVDYGVLPDCT